MNLPPVFDWRKRNINPVMQTMNYTTYSLPDFTDNKMKGEIYDMYRPEIKNFTEMASEKKIEDKNERSESWIMKSALHMCAMIYRKIAGRASSPDPSYHDCEPSQEAPDKIWQGAKTENKNVEAHTTGFAYSDMTDDYKSVVASCEDKLNKVRQLITSKPAPSSPKCTTYRCRRRRRVFVESRSVEDSYQDAFSPEDFISESNGDELAFVIPYQYQNCEMIGIDGPKTKIESPTMKIEKPVDVKSQVSENKEDLNFKPEIIKTEVVEHIEPTKEENKTNIETVSSCESKIMQLQAMLKERRKMNTKTMLNSSNSAPEPVKDLLIEQPKPKIIPTQKTQDKRFRNQHRLSTGKRKKAETKKLIQDDMLFADEIAESPSSFENSPILVSMPLDKSSTLSLDKSVGSLGVTPTEDCFDEVAGRFHNASGTESDDSFQVVFTDSPRAMRPSDCESEDSFIVFEDSPDSCYTSNDVFGDESESEYSDTDSEISDSGCGDSDELKMPHNMSKTLLDLTDDRLYEENKDVVDSAVKMCVEIPNDDLDLDSVCEVKSTGLLLDDAKKRMRKNQPPKKVHFSEKPPKVHVMRVWTFAARQARAGHWERHALDRERFKRRIADADMALSWVLKPQHRSRVMFQRFMPWWNAQKRKELAEKKAKAEEEKKRLEEERVKEEQRVEEERKIAEENKVIEGENKIIEIENGKNAEQNGKIVEEISKVNKEDSKDQGIKEENTSTKANIKQKRKIEKDHRNTQGKQNDVKEKQQNNNQEVIKEKQKNIKEMNNKKDKLKSNDNDKPYIVHSPIIMDKERTNLNVTNKLNSATSNKNLNDIKKGNLEIILKEDTRLIPLTVNSNEAVS